MVTNLDPASELFLSNVNRIQQRLAEANRQVASGKRIIQPSDAPDQIDALLQLRADRQRNTQIRSNLGLALTEHEVRTLTAEVKRRADAGPLSNDELDDLLRGSVPA